MNKLLSVCIIAKNEEKMLPGCLDSVKDCAGEIILVDTGSSDRTKEIALAYGCKLYDFPWENDFAKARNVALDKATLPFILSIDADERLLNPDLLVAEIENAPENIYGWLVKVTSEAARKGTGTDTYTIQLLRLFRNHPEIRFYGSIHEQIISSIVNLKYKIKNTDIAMIHLGYSFDAAEMEKKQLRNLTMLDIAIKNDPSNGYNIFQRAKTCLTLGQLEEAEKDVKRSLEILKPEDPTYSQSLNYGAVVAYRLGQNELSITRAKKSLEIIPNQSFANFILAENYADMHQYCEALRHYKNMEDSGESSGMMAQIAGDYKMPDAQLQFKIGRMLLKIGEAEAASLRFDKGLAISPDDVNLLTGKANAAFKLRQFHLAKQLIGKASTLAPQLLQLKDYLSQIDKALTASKQTEKDEKSEVITNTPTISERSLLCLCMIVKNEAALLAGCLESVKGIVDEIVVVDTGSTDSTKEIAANYGAKIYDFPWQNDFAMARNESIKHCNSDWILYLDADERLNFGGNTLRKLLENTPDEIGAILCTIESRHSTLTGESELHRGAYPRIFRNYGYPSIRFEGRVHEQISPSITELGKAMQFSEIIIIHLGYDRTREEMEEKIKRNYSMLMQHIKEEPVNAFAWYQLGQTLAQMNLLNEAENAVHFAIQVGTLSDSVLASAASTMAQLTGNKKKYDEALRWAELSLEKAPKQLYALHIKAYALLYLNRPVEAEQLFLEVKRRKLNDSGAPRSGFDIVIPDEAIDGGIAKARAMIARKKQ